MLVTGCSGIGLETALAFAARGDAVAATMRDLSKPDELRRRAASEGLELDVVPLDVVDDDSVTAATAEVEGRLGPIDVLVNNAGVA
jgi:NAD(P)-dependent dehydrogenase (short-subunit alcohol dehydrogenase family)